MGVRPSVSVSEEMFSKEGLKELILRGPLIVNLEDLVPSLINSSIYKGYDPALVSHAF